MQRVDTLLEPFVGGLSRVDGTAFDDRLRGCIPIIRDVRRLPCRAKLLARTDRLSTAEPRTRHSWLGTSKRRMGRDYLRGPLAGAVRHHRRDNRARRQARTFEQLGQPRSGPNAFDADAPEAAAPCRSVHLGLTDSAARCWDNRPLKADSLRSNQCCRPKGTTASSKADVRRFRATE